MTRLERKKYICEMRGNVEGLIFDYAGLRCYKKDEKRFIKERNDLTELKIEKSKRAEDWNKFYRGSVNTWSIFG